MQPLKYLGRTIRLVLDCSVVLLAIAFILACALVSAVAAAYRTLMVWIVHHGDAKPRSRAGWQQGI